MKQALRALIALLAAILAYRIGYTKRLRDGAEGVALFFEDRLMRRKAAKARSEQETSE